MQHIAMAPHSESENASHSISNDNALLRAQSFSQASEDSQTAAEFINSQLQLEADAREALPYKFDTCTQPLGPLRQLLFACLTCNPPPPTSSETYTPAAVCYSCSVSCHGEHTLVELFNKRNFVCDCGTTRLPSTSPCSLRFNSVANQKGGVIQEPAEPKNQYNHNFRNRFCGCECEYDAHQQKGTMFQCLGLGTEEDGCCGEDWWHSSCVVGLGPEWYEEQIAAKMERRGKQKTEIKCAGENVNEEDTAATDGEDEEDDIVPPGFPDEDDFEGFICYKCVNSHPWIKRYAGADGFLLPVFKRSAAPSPEAKPEVPKFNDTPAETSLPSRKRKSNEEESEAQAPAKRAKDASQDDGTDNEPRAESAVETDSIPSTTSPVTSACKYELLPPAPQGTISLFFKPDFRSRLCRCPSCFPRLARHPQLLEEEENYEPPVSSDGDGDGSTVGSGSLLDRGERALTNVDRVRAIEGVMAYNQLKEKLKPFFREFAESGKAISAEDIKAHFAKMRGDEEAIRKAGEDAARSEDHRREQSGY